MVFSPDDTTDFFDIVSPVGWDCRIHPLHFWKVISPLHPNDCPVYDTKQSDGELPVMLELWRIRNTPSLPSLLGPLSRSGSTWKALIYRSNWTVGFLNSVQTNDLRWIELLEIELFDYFTVCKQMTDVELNS